MHIITYICTYSMNICKYVRMFSQELYMLCIYVHMHVQVKMCTLCCYVCMYVHKYMRLSPDDIIHRSCAG